MSIFVKKVKPEDMLNEALHVSLVSCAKYIQRELGDTSPLQVLATEASAKIQGSVIRYDETSILTLEKMLKDVVNPQLAKGYNPPILMLCILTYLLNDVNYEPTTLVYNKHKQFVNEAIVSISHSSTEFLLKTIRTLIELIENDNYCDVPKSLLAIETAANDILNIANEKKARSFFMIFINGNKDLTKYPIEEAEEIIAKLRPKCSAFDYVELIDSRKNRGEYVIGNHYDVMVNNDIVTEEPSIWLGALNLYTEEVKKAIDNRANAIEVKIINTITEDEVRYFANPVFTFLEDPSYSVWVGGTEVNDVYLTKLDARELENSYRANGYTDVQIGLGKNEPVEPEQDVVITPDNTNDDGDLYDVLVQDSSILNSLVTLSAAKALFDDIVKDKKAAIGGTNIQSDYKIVVVKILPDSKPSVVYNFETFAPVVVSTSELIDAIKNDTVTSIGDNNTYTVQSEFAGAVSLLDIKDVDQIIEAAKENNVDKVEELTSGEDVVKPTGSLTVDVEMPKRGENPVCKPVDDTRVFEESTTGLRGSVENVVHVDDVAFDSNKEDEVVEVEEPNLAIRGLVKEDGKIDLQTVDVCEQVAKVEPIKQNKPDKNDKAIKIVLINANCDIIEFDTNNEMMGEVGKVVKQTANVDVLKKEHGLYGKLCKDNVKGNNYDLILIEKGSYAKIETMTKFKVTAKDMSTSYLKYILDL